MSVQAAPVEFSELRESEVVELSSSSAVQRWLRKREPNTKKYYQHGLEKLLEWTPKRISVKTPEELLAWAKKQADGTVVQDLIDEYTEKMTKSNAHVTTALIRSFLTRNAYRELPKIDWTKTMSFSEGYTRESIQGLLSYLPKSIHKLYVLFAKDSGLRANDLLYLRWKHIAKDFESGQQFIAIEFEDDRYSRRKAPGRTFIGPNAIDLLKKLIAEGVVKKNSEARIFPFVYRSITTDLTRAKMKAALSSEVRPSHGLRQFFEASLDRVGMDYHKKMQIEGHSNGVREAYTSRRREELRDLYVQAYRFLDLTEKAVVSNEVKTLQETVSQQALHIEALKAQIAESENKGRLVTEVLETVRKMQKRIDDLEKKN